jgi:hypothetical protein
VSVGAVLGGGDRFYGKQQRAGRIRLIGCTAQLHGKELRRHNCCCSTKGAAAIPPLRGCSVCRSAGGWGGS